ncbi:MAG: hypothetical protein EPO20_25675 [Betaproteobacteria bacterium]|nr:MAG: hypothetical protein EPO20_25675 [Betaproteobacteria bacterium]
MRKLNLTVGIALLALALPSANAGAEGTFFVSERASRAATAPYEDTEFDRDLPILAERMEGKQWTAGAPHEDTLVDRGWPYLPQLAEAETSASAGATVEYGWAWAGDHNFIAPAQ